MWKIFSNYVKKLSENPILLAISILLTISGIVTPLINLGIWFYSEYNPDIDLIFHQEFGEIEIWNGYKTLKNVSGLVKINCEGANYSNSFNFKFADGSLILPKGNNKFLVSTDVEFLNLIKNYEKECPQGVFYLGRYFKNLSNDKNRKHQLENVFSYEFIIDDYGNLSKINKKNHIKQIRTNFCSRCFINMEIKAANLKNPKSESGFFSFVTYWEKISFPEKIDSEAVVKYIDRNQLFFPMGRNNTPCRDLDDIDCAMYFCKEINKKYPYSLHCVEPKRDSIC